MASSLDFIEIFHQMRIQNHSEDRCLNPPPPPPRKSQPLRYGQSPQRAGYQAKQNKNKTSTTNKFVFSYNFELS